MSSLSRMQGFAAPEVTRSLVGAGPTSCRSARPALARRRLPSSWSMKTSRSEGNDARYLAHPRRHSQRAAGLPRKRSIVVTMGRPAGHLSRRADHRHLRNPGLLSEQWPGQVRHPSAALPAPDSGHHAGHSCCVHRHRRARAGTLEPLLTTPIVGKSSSWARRRR